MKTKENFHKLIDSIGDERVLNGYYQLIQRLNKAQSGALWNGLSHSEKEELLLSYEESFDPGQLISHQQVEAQHGKWLGK